MFVNRIFFKLQINLMSRTMGKIFIKVLKLIIIKLIKILILLIKMIILEFNLIKLIK